MIQFGGLVSISVALYITMVCIHILCDMFFLASEYGSNVCVLYFSYNVGWFPLVLEANKTGKVVVKYYDLASYNFVCCKLNYLEDGQSCSSVNGTYFE